MKLFVKLGAACCLGLLLAACGESPAPKTDVNKTEAPAAQVPQTQAPQDGVKTEPAQGQ